MAEVIVSSEGYLKQRITAGRHVLIADEPAGAGGSDAGPDPYSFLLAALGACTSMTLQMYARHKGIPLEGVEVTLRHQRVHAADCDDCENKESRVDKIERHISLAGNLTDAQRQRLLEISQRCPVHKTLKSEIWIDDHLS